MPFRTPLNLLLPPQPESLLSKVRAEKMSIWKPVGGGGNAAGTVQRWRLRCLSRTPTAAAKNQSFRKAKTTVRFSTDYLEPGHWPSDTEAMEHVQRFQAAILDEINDRPQPRKTVAQDTHPENRTCGTAQSEIVLQVSYHSNRHYKTKESISTHYFGRRKQLNFSVLV